jgi:putative membrane protein
VSPPETPRFIDGPDTPKLTAVLDKPELRQSEPMLLDPEAGAAARIEPNWLPPAIVIDRLPLGSLGYTAIGFGVLAVTWFLVSIGGFVADQFQISTGFGAAVLAAEALGIGLIGFAGWREWRSIRRLRNAEYLRIALQGKADLEKTRADARNWLTAIVTRLTNAPAIDAALRSAASVDEIRAILRNQAAPDLERAARRVGFTAAQQGAAFVALNPHSAWDGIAVGFCGLRVIRQVATIYGMRPGPIVTWALLRGIGRMAVEITAADLLAQAATEQMMDMPVLSRLFKAVPGSSVAAIRLHRLALAAARACSPVG